MEIVSGEHPENAYDRDRLLLAQTSWKSRAKGNVPYVSCQSGIVPLVSPAEVASRIDVSLVVTSNAIWPPALELEEVQLDFDRGGIWRFSSGNPSQFWEKILLRTTMKLIAGVPWTVISALFQRVFLLECRDIARGHVVRASSSDQKNPKIHRKRNRSVCDHLFVARLECWNLVLEI